MDVDKIHLFQLEEPKSGDTIATIETTQGAFEVVLYPQRAPKAVENFTTHVTEGLLQRPENFPGGEEQPHQTGDPNNDGTGGDSIWGGPFEDEFGYDLWHFTGRSVWCPPGRTTGASSMWSVPANCPRRPSARWKRQNTRKR